MSTLDSDPDPQALTEDVSDNLRKMCKYKECCVILAQPCKTHYSINTQGHGKAFGALFSAKTWCFPPLLNLSYSCQETFEWKHDAYINHRGAGALLSFKNLLLTAKTWRKKGKREEKKWKKKTFLCSGVLYSVFNHRKQERNLFLWMLFNKISQKMSLIGSQNICRLLRVVLSSEHFLFVQF